MGFKKIRTFVANGQASMTDLTGDRILMTPFEFPLQNTYFDVNKVIFIITPYSEDYFKNGLGLRLDLLFDGKSLIDMPLNIAAKDVAFIMTSHYNKYKFETEIFKTKNINMAYFNATGISQVAFIFIYGNVYEVTTG